MPITAIARNFDGDPNIVTIVTSDDLATITTADYVTSQQTEIESLQNGEFQWADTDIVLISYAPDFLVNFFKYDAATASFVANPAAGGLSDTLASGRIFVGSAGNVATGVAMSGDTTISNAGVVAIGANKVLSSMVSPLLLKYIAVPITAAEFNGMYGAPKLLIAAGGANTLIVVEQMVLAMTFVSAQYAAGGVVAAQYDSTVHGAGVLITAAEAAADFTGAAASTTFRSLTSTDVAPFATSVNKGVYLSNQTAAFTTGDSTFVAHLWYRTIPTT